MPSKWPCIFFLPLHLSPHSVPSATDTPSSYKAASEQISSTACMKQAQLSFAGLRYQVLFLKRKNLWGKWSAFEQLSWLLRHCHAQTTVFAAQGHVISLFCQNLLYLLPPELFPFSLWNLCSWHFLSFFDVLVASQSFTMSSSSCPKPTSSPITYSGGIFVTGPQVIFPFAKGLPVERAASFVHYFSFLFPQGQAFL